jgi:hypothetical protein
MLPKIGDLIKVVHRRRTSNSSSWNDSIDSRTLRTDIALIFISLKVGAQDANDKIVFIHPKFGLSFVYADPKVFRICILV